MISYHIKIFITKITNYNVLVNASKFNYFYNHYNYKNLSALLRYSKSKLYRTFYFFNVVTNWNWNQRTYTYTACLFDFLCRKFKHNSILFWIISTSLLMFLVYSNFPPKMFNLHYFVCLLVVNGKYFFHNIIILMEKIFYYLI